MTLPEALELLDYFGEHPPAHRAIAIAHGFKKKEPDQVINVGPEILKQLGPGGMITRAALAGIVSPKGPSSG